MIKPNEGAVRANREVSWFSAAWNWARDHGITNAPNPPLESSVTRSAAGTSTSRTTSWPPSSFMPEPLREAIELAYLIGQRPGDLRGICETDIRDGVLVLEQDKTGAKLRIEITGALADLIGRIKARKASIEGVRSLALICNEAGQPMLKSAMRYRFDKARDAAAAATSDKTVAARLRSIQFRDLRAKATSDIDALDKAQRLLGHTKRDMTEHYVRKQRGEKVSPVK